MSVPCCSDTQGNSLFISFIFLCNFGIPGIIHSKYIKCSILTAYLPTYIHISDSDPSKDINSIIKKKKKKLTNPPQISNEILLQASNKNSVCALEVLHSNHTINCNYNMLWALESDAIFIQ